MDDGSLKKYKTTQAFILSTDSFSKEQVLFLGALIYTKFNIHVNYHKQQDTYRIYIPSKHFKAFREIILPHMHGRTAVTNLVY